MTQDNIWAFRIENGHGTGDISLIPTLTKIGMPGILWISLKFASKKQFQVTTQRITPEPESSLERVPSSFAGCGAEKQRRSFIMQKRAARRGQRALAFLLCLLMVVTLLPVMGASAAEGDVSAEGVKLSKTLTLETDGTYTINLKAYATGTVTSTTVTEPVPTDFVLVLDQSGSMADSITSYTYTEEKSQGYSYNDLNNRTLYYKDGDTYYQVKRDSYKTWSWPSSTDHYYLYYQKDGTTYYLSGTGTTTTRPSEYTNKSDIIWAGVLYRRTATSSQTKLEALKTAVTNFVNSVKDQTDENGKQVAHRIAIVGFASDGSDYNNTELFVGKNSYTYNSSQIQSQYKNALQDVTTPAGQSNLTASINALNADGSTYAQYGFMMANSVLNARKVTTYQKADGTTANRGAVVVMFTDGQPGYNSSDSDQLSTANSTVAEAKTTKQNAKVFTIGVFSVADSTKLKTENQWGKTTYSTYTIADYMNAVSSNYPSATSLSAMGTRSTDGVDYYAKADDSEALNDAFQSVSSSVNNSSTSCTLTGESVLTDVISGNLDLPKNFNASTNVHVSTQTCNGKNEDGALTWQAATPFNSATVSTNGKTVNVSGFDYSQNYVTGEANTGKKLIVTITGLLPNRDGADMPSNEATSGIYDGGNLVAPFEVPAFSVDLENRVVDFGMTVNIGANVLNTNAATNQYGTFALNNNTYTYNLKPVKDDNDNYTFGFTGVDSSLYFNNGSWTKVNVIPANNVYYDDDLLDSSSTFTDGDYGYDVAVENAANNTADIAKGSKKVFTFTGTGIDLYCTTKSDSGSVFAQLRKVNDDNSLSVVPGVNDISMNDTYESGTLYNVPTISFRNLESGKYQVTLYTDKTVDYQLDGVRVYNPGNADVETLYNADEKNATFTKVRDLLLEANSFNDGDASVTGVVYTDQIREGSHNTTAIDTYEKVGPKNEVYLATGNAIAFKVDNYQSGMKVMVGLSAPEAKSGKVMMSNGIEKAPTDVKSAVDMYYNVTPNADGYVVIKNTSDALISVTNVKLSGTANANGANTLSVDEGLLAYMASFDTLEVTEPAPVEPEPTPETPANNTVSAIIHAIWAQVKDSIGRLFGRL